MTDEMLGTPNDVITITNAEYQTLIDAIHEAFEDGRRRGLEDAAKWQDGSTGVSRLLVEKMLRDWQEGCRDHPALWNQANVLCDRLAALPNINCGTAA